MRTLALGREDRRARWPRPRRRAALVGSGDAPWISAAKYRHRFTCGPAFASRKVMSKPVLAMCGLWGAVLATAGCLSSRVRTPAPR